MILFLSPPRAIKVSPINLYIHMGSSRIYLHKRVRDKVKLYANHSMIFMILTINLVGVTAQPIPDAKADNPQSAFIKADRFMSNTNSLFLGQQVSAIFIPEVASGTGKVYYVDDTAGEDANNGLSPASAWKTIEKVNSAPLNPRDSVLFKRGGVWRGQLMPKSGNDSGYITYGAYGSGVKPLLLGSAERDNVSDWIDEGSHLWSMPMWIDIGNIIFDHEESVGTKVWDKDALDKQGKFWYDESSLKVYLYSVSNPATYYSDIELALTRHIVEESGRSYIIYQDLALRYGGAHGIGGVNTHHIIIRRCDISYIGGGKQYGTTRYGNGIEFWCSAHDNLVEGNRLWEIYDAALTNQGSDFNSQYNITYRNNIIWDCHYSFEYWNRPENSTTDNIHFENNICVDAGYGWGNEQRPDPGGMHIILFANTAKTSNIFIRNNILCEAKSGILYVFNPWNGLDDVLLDYNLYHQTVQEGFYVIVSYQDRSYILFSEYQVSTGKDKNSIYANPLFIDLFDLDFHYQPGSPAIDNGFNTGIPKDFDGVSRPQGKNYDIGAYEYIPTKSNTHTRISKGYYFIQQVNSFSSSLYGAISTIDEAESIARVLKEHSDSGVEYSTLSYHPQDVSVCVQIARVFQSSGIDLWLSSTSLQGYILHFNNEIFPEQYRAYSMAPNGTIIPAKIWTVCPDEKVLAFDVLNPDAMTWFIGRYKTLFLEPMRNYTSGYFFGEDCLYYGFPYSGYENNQKINYWELPAYSDSVLKLWQRYCIDHNITYKGVVVSKFPVHSKDMVSNGGGKTEYYPGYKVPASVEIGTPIISIPRDEGVWAAWDDFVTSQYVESWIGGISKAVYEVNEGNPNFKGVIYFGLHDWALGYEEVTDPSFKVDPLQRWVPWGTQRGVQLSKICALPYVDYIICETFPPIRANLEAFISEYYRIVKQNNKEFGLMLHRDDNWGLDEGDSETDRWNLIYKYCPTIIARYPIDRLFPTDKFYNETKEQLFDKRLLEYRSTFDKVPPVTTVVIGDPKHQGGTALYVSDGTTFTLSAADEGSGVRETSYRVNGGSWTSYIEPFSISSLSEGAHIICYRSTDRVGNNETEETLAVYLDRTAPTITNIVVAPSNPAWGDLIRISASIDDVLSGVREASIYYSTNGGTMWSRVTILAPIPSAKAYEGTIPSQQVMARVQFYIEASDNLGNVARTTTQEFTVAMPIWLYEIMGIVTALIVVATMRRRRPSVPPPSPPPPER